RGWRMGEPAHLKPKDAAPGRPSRRMPPGRRRYEKRKAGDRTRRDKSGQGGCGGRPIKSQTGMPPGRRRYEKTKAGPTLKNEGWGTRKSKEKQIPRSWPKADSLGMDFLTDESERRKA